MAQFRVEFVLDEASGKYRAELYHPERAEVMLVRTEPLFASQQEALLGVVKLFEKAMPRPRKPRKIARKKAKSKRRRKA